MIQNITEKHINVLNAFVQSYLSWLYIQNPYMNDTFTTREILNYMFKNISLPWIIKKIINEDKFYVMSLIYEYVESQKEWVSMFEESIPINCTAIGAFTFNKKLKEKKKPTEKQLQYFDNLNSKKGNEITVSERNNMGMDELSLCIDYLKKR